MSNEYSQRVQGGGAPPMLVAYPHLQDEICDGLRKGMPVSDIFATLNIKLTNFYTWMKKGQKQVRGVYREFYEAVETAKMERWGSTQHELERVLYEDALETQVVIDRKVTRVTTLTREEWEIMGEKCDDKELAKRFNEDSIILKEEVIKREQAPNSSRALQILERKAAREWGKK